MRLLVLGATGGTGKAVIRQAIERGHAITAFARSPQKLGSLIDRVTVRQGDPRRVAELQRVLPGHDAVLSALGPPGPGPTTILRAGARWRRSVAPTSRIFCWTSSSTIVTPIASSESPAGTEVGHESLPVTFGHRVPGFGCHPGPPLAVAALIRHADLALLAREKLEV